MKEGAFSALQSDELPLPNINEVLDRLIIPPHTKKRFKERARAGDIDKSLLRAGRVSRNSPSWRASEDYQHSLDLYLLFPFWWEDGGEDEGCLLLEHKGTHYVAKTFISRSSNDAHVSPRLPSMPQKIVHRVSQITRTSESEAAHTIQNLRVTEKRPAWLRAEADAWIDGGSWAVSLQRELVGAGNPYHYSWQKVYARHEEKKRRAKERYQRKMS